jgi:hypothetical protein
VSGVPTTGFCRKAVYELLGRMMPLGPATLPLSSSCLQTEDVMMRCCPVQEGARLHHSEYQGALCAGSYAG